MITGRDLFKTLGGFWFDIKELEALCSAVVQVWNQNNQEIRELENATSRHKIDIYRTIEWLPINVEETNEIIEYDSNKEYDFGLIYDQAERTINVKIPEYIVSSEYISDKILNPSIKVETGTEHSFSIDTNLNTLWLHNAKVDANDLYTQFGYALGLKLPSSQQYKDLINALMDSIVNGPSEGTLRRALTAMIGNDKFTIGWDVSGIVLNKNFTGMCEDIPFMNQDMPVSLSTDDELTRIDIESIPSVFMDEVHKRGKEAFKKVTDKCELYKVQKMLAIQPAQDEDDQNIVSQNGIMNYVMFHRFN